MLSQVRLALEREILALGYEVESVVFFQATLNM